MADGLLVGLLVGMVVRADVGDLGAALETGRDGVDGGLAVDGLWLDLSVGHGGREEESGGCGEGRGTSRWLAGLAG